MTLTVKLIDNKAEIIVHNPRREKHYSRPLTFQEVEIINDYGQEIGTKILVDRNRKRKYQ